ncbi:hypothetical protein HDU67_003865, partial [Dinochytrium kinnereticum]
MSLKLSSSSDLTECSFMVGCDDSAESAGMKVEQMFFHSRDGTRVPMWTARGSEVVKRAEAGWKPAAVWMTGYGGFMVARMPTFSALAVAMLDASPRSMFVLVNARGGKEYGMEWYDGGRNLRKKNVFDDLVSAGRFLVAEGWTENGHLGIQGASNGGLLAAAVSLQAPELFGAAVVDVGVHDINRFEKFTFGRAWVNDYGRAENATESIARLSWSPVQTVQNMIPGGFKFSPTFISTGDHDTRVSPLHSLKLAAGMQRVAEGGVRSLVICRIRELSGHNIFSTERQAQAWAEKMAFWAHMVRAEGL